MKKLIISIALFVLCISALCITAGANGAEGEIVSLSVQTYPTKTVYGAFEEFDPSGMTLRAVYSDGSEKIVNSEGDMILYQKDDRLRVGDSYVIISLGGARTTVPVTVNRISYDLSALDLSGFSVTYNGKYQSYSQMLPTIMGQDGIPLVMSAVGGSVDAGSYDIRIDFHTESKDYILWGYLKEKDAKLYLKIRYGILGQTMNLPGKPGRKVSSLAYTVANRIFGFN